MAHCLAAFRLFFSHANSSENTNFFEYGIKPCIIGQSA